jgi:hypothetical protein
MLYHGSKTPDLKILKPFARKEISGRSCVFACNDKRFALAMIYGNDADFSVGYIVDEKTVAETMYMTEVRKDGFSVLDAPGFLYEVEDTGFMPDPHLSHREFICPNEVPILRETPIKNVMEELKKSDIVFTSFAS